MNVATGKSCWIQTASGGKFFPVEPRPVDINIYDIAYVLAGEVRFGGHCRPRISVAQHSCMVADRLPLKHKLWGILHDASEYIVRDLNRPIKRLLPKYKKIELGIQRAIAEKFNLEWPMPAIIHDVDNRVGITEAKFCMKPLQPGFTFDGVEPYPDLVIKPWGRKRAEREFLKSFWNLWGTRHESL